MLSTALMNFSVSRLAKLVNRERCPWTSVTRYCSNNWLIIFRPLTHRMKNLWTFWGTNEPTRKAKGEEKWKHLATAEYKILLEGQIAGSWDIFPESSCMVYIYCVGMSKQDLTAQFDFQHMQTLVVRTQDPNGRSGFTVFSMKLSWLSMRYLKSGSSNTRIFIYTHLATLYFYCSLTVTRE